MWTENELATFHTVGDRRRRGPLVLQGTPSPCLHRRHLCVETFHTISKRCRTIGLIGLGCLDAGGHTDALDVADLPLLATSFAGTSLQPLPSATSRDSRSSTPSLSLSRLLTTRQRQALPLSQRLCFLSLLSTRPFLACLTRSKSTVCA